MLVFSRVGFSLHQRILKEIYVNDLEFLVFIRDHESSKEDHKLLANRILHSVLLRGYQRLELIIMILMEY